MVPSSTGLKMDRPVRTEALDFLGQEIAEGDWIVYPTGGTSARMVLAKVKRIELLDGKSSWSLVHDGLRGLSRVRLVVNRHREGIHTSDASEGYWSIDEKREVRVDQLHRVVKVVPPNGKKGE